MAEICRICLKAKDVLNTNVLEYVDIVENLVEIEVNLLIFSLIVSRCYFHLELQYITVRPKPGAAANDLYQL